MDCVKSLCSLLIPKEGTCKTLHNSFKWYKHCVTTLARAEKATDGKKEKQQSTFQKPRAPPELQRSQGAARHNVTPTVCTLKQTPTILAPNELKFLLSDGAFFSSVWPKLHKAQSLQLRKQLKLFVAEVRQAAQSDHATVRMSPPTRPGQLA